MWRLAPTRMRWPRLLWSGGMLLTGLALAGLLTTQLAGCGGNGSGGTGEGDGNSSDISAEFVGRQSCIECHQQEHEQWTGTHHDRAMEKATEQTVLGDFSGTTFTHQGVTSRFYREDGRFMVRTEGPDGRMQDYAIDYTFGVEPLQQYLIKFPKGRYQVLSIAWDTRPEEEGGQRWFHVNPDEQIDHDDPLHWTGPLQTWNRQCASCHSTNLRKNFDLASDSYDTHWSEIDVSCEACHGPGSEHVKWAESAPADRESVDGHYGLTTDLKSPYPDTTPAKEAAKLDLPRADNQINSCFLCHARRSEVHPGYTHGEPFMDHYAPQILREGVYHADGQIDGEVYVYGSYVQSKMYHQGVACSDCHDPHTTELRAPGNALCIRCHNAADYVTKEHHHHQPGTPGAKCVNCHMPQKTYMVVDPRRDHSIRVPRPDLSAKIGTPNACNKCHAEESAQWAADAVEKWHGPDRPDSPHWGPTIAAGRDRKPEALPKLIDLAENEDRPAIVRATAVDLLARYARDGGAADVIRRATDWSDPLLRRTAATALTALPVQQRLTAGAPLLKDQYRAVRTEAARVLATVPQNMLDAPQMDAFNAAADEYKTGQRAVADQLAGLMNLANFFANQNDSEQALRYFRGAIRKRPHAAQPRLHIAQLLSRMGRNRDARKHLEEALKHHPDHGELHYDLGLLIAEQQNLAKATEHLARAAELMPQRPRVHYNLGLAYQRSDQPDKAARALRRAHELDPQSPDYMYALAILHLQQNQPRQAMQYVRRMLQNNPDSRRARQLIRRMQRGRRGGRTQQRQSPRAPGSGGPR